MHKPITRDRSIASRGNSEATESLILDLLVDSPMGSGELAKCLLRTQAATTLHLTALVGRGLVERVREGRSIVYRRATP